MADAVVWFLTIELLGVAALPWLYHIFRFLPDRGITLAKPAILLSVCYLLWVFGLVRLLPNTPLTLWAISLAIGAGAVWLASQKWDEFRDFLRNNWRVLLTAELVFLFMFVAWALVVSGSPSITHTEKPMDFMLLNAAHQARFFPAEDAWLSGHSISYYYFGHIIMASLSKMSGVATSAGYNLAIATLPALAGAVCFGLAYNLVRLSGGGVRWALGAGAAAPAMILLAGNLVGGLEFVRLRGWGGDGFWDWAAVGGLDAAAAGAGAFPEDFWWWFRSTRVISTVEDGTILDYTITEFPAFSFLLGDLHAHVLAIPFLLLGIGAILNLYSSPDRLQFSWVMRRPFPAVAVALSGGALAFINFWDFPTFLAILAAALILKGCRDYPDTLLQAFSAAAAVFLTIFVLAVALFAPVYGTFSGQTSGALPLREIATSPFHLLLVLGLFLLLSLALLAKLLSKARMPGVEETPLAVVALLLGFVPLGVWMATAFLLAIVTDGAGAALADLGRRLTLAAPAGIVVSAAAYGAAYLARRGDIASPFLLLIMAMGFFLVMTAELFHIVDSFGGAWRRMNTVFKTYYQAWLLLGIAASFGLYALWSALPRIRESTLAIATLRFAGACGGGAFVALLLVASFYYTLGATLDRGGAYGSAAEGRTLDGIAFLESQDPGEHEAIKWLRDEAEPGRIVEAVGDDYSRFGFISASTGLPTVLGWKGHEIQWRGSSEPFAGREEDISTIYSGRDPGEALRLLNQYGVRYVYLGSREREQYGVSSLPEYSDFLKTVFQQENVVVYEVWDDPDL